VGFAALAEVSMPDTPSLELPRLIAMAWGERMKQQRFQSAALVALLGYLLSREQANEELEAGWDAAHAHGRR